MDGTIYLGDRLLPGAVEFLALLNERKISYYFLTNNSSKNWWQYAEKLSKLGLSVAENQILTSGEATAIYLHQQKPGARIFLSGTPALETDFNCYGFELVSEQPDFIVLGFDTTVTYTKLWKLCDFIRAGLPFIATHPDINCPTGNGYMPDIGALIAFIQASTSRSPDVTIGKPNKPIIDALVERSGIPLESMCIVGDRLYTDIALGDFGMVTVLVLTGEARLADLAGSLHQPDYVIENLASLVNAYHRI
jgi:4-nitrophenyl phosphatase